MTDWEFGLSESEDWPIHQPKDGWEAAEKQLPGYSRINANKSKQSRYYYKIKAEKNEEERIKAMATHKSIKKFFHAGPGRTTKSIESLEQVDEEHQGDQKIVAQDIEDLVTQIKAIKGNSRHLERAHRVLDFLRLSSSKGQNSCWVKDSVGIANAAGKGVAFARKLRRWARQWLSNRIEIPQPRSATHVRRRTLFEDEEVNSAVREYLNINSWKSTVKGVCDSVNDVLDSRSAASNLGLRALSNEESGISDRTARRWLTKLGWIYSRDKKGYVDGHEREDVVKYRNEVFLPKMKAIEESLVEYTEEGEIEKQYPYGPRRILVTHDESTFNANDDQKSHWKPKGIEPLKSKSKGKGLMVSEFLTAADGPLRFQASDREEIERARVIVKYGNGPSDDGYWTGEKMVEQTKAAISIFEKRFPGSIGVFCFDNSSGHAAFAADALVASRMNMNPGGKQPVMRSTSFQSKHQSMVFLPDEAPHPTLIGKPKGLKRVLEERGLWRDGLTKRCGKSKGEKGSSVLDQCVCGRDCCAFRIMEAQPDFASEKSLLQFTVEKLGHECIFYPKFHCELNYIEYYWGAVKHYTRAHCDYRFASLEKTILAGLDSVSLETIRRFAMRSKRWLMAYSDGLTPGQKEFAERVYSSHRRLPQKPSM